MLRSPREHASNLQDAPLGPEDAHGRDDIEESFINVGQLTSGAGTGSNLLPTRVVVGRKGSGKTHILRHIEHVSRGQGRDVSLSQIDRNLFAENALNPFKGGLGPAAARAFWTDVWRFALIVAVLSRFMCKRRDQRAVAALEKVGMSLEELRSDFAPFMFDCMRPLDPVQALQKIQNTHRSISGLQLAFRGIVFSEIEAELGHLLQHYGEVHFIIDGLDDLAWIDPRSWLDLQVGLFKLVFLQSASRAYMKSVHLTISLRNYVYSHALKDTHADRVGAGVLKLTWDAEAAKLFLNQRLLQVCDGNFANASRLKGARPLASWLGFDSYRPASRSQAEDVEYYVLRHTRCAPRQVIKAFNEICGVYNRLHLRGVEFTPEAFGSAVASRARDHARAMISTAAEELLSMLMNSLTLPHQPSQKSSAQDYHLTVASDALAAAIRQCRREICDREDLRIACLLALDAFDLDVDEAHLSRLVEATLWRSGIVAYRATDPNGIKGWRYTWTEGELGMETFPDHVTRIGFHPTMIDLCDLEVDVDGPVF